MALTHQIRPIAQFIYKDNMILSLTDLIYDPLTYRSVCSSAITIPLREFSIAGHTLISCSKELAALTKALKVTNMSSARVLTLLSCSIWLLSVPNHGFRDTKNCKTGETCWWRGNGIFQAKIAESQKTYSLGVLFKTTAILPNTSWCYF